MSNSLFFPKLTRRVQYRLTRQNTFYKDYTKYRQEIREDCLGRCVYCDCHENHLGGHQSMHLDHFRPKERREFVHLINDPRNLLWGCSVCNRLKWDHWDSKDSTSSVDGEYGFIDPFLEDRQEYFSIENDGRLQPLKPPAKYMIELLGLNNHNRRRLRELRLQSFELLPEIDEEITYLQNKAELTPDEDQLLAKLQRSQRIHLYILDFTLYP